MDGDAKRPESVQGRELSRERRRKREGGEGEKERERGGEKRDQSKCARWGNLSFKWMKHLRASTISGINRERRRFVRGKERACRRASERRETASRRGGIPREGDNRSRAVEVTLWLFDPAVPAN